MDFPGFHFKVAKRRHQPEVKYFMENKTTFKTKSTDLYICLEGRIETSEAVNIFFEITIQSCCV
jgi:hypothetical protein